MRSGPGRLPGAPVVGVCRGAVAPGRPNYWPGRGGPRQRHHRPGLLRGAVFVSWASCGRWSVGPGRVVAHDEDLSSPKPGGLRPEPTCARPRRWSRRSSRYCANVVTIVKRSRLGTTNRTPRG